MDIEECGQCIHNCFVKINEEIDLEEKNLFISWFTRMVIHGLIAGLFECT